MTDTMSFDIIHIDHMLPLASFDLTKPEEHTCERLYQYLNEYILLSTYSPGYYVFFFGFGWTPTSIAGGSAERKVPGACYSE